MGLRTITEYGPLFCIRGNAQAIHTYSSLLFEASHINPEDYDQQRMLTPLEEMRIAALHRGSGPKGCRPGQWESFDGFLLDIPRLEFAAIIPKGEYVTICLLGKEVDQELVNRFMSSPEVRDCLPLEWEP